MRISTIKEYILLAEKLNFTETAAALFLSQSTLSKHITDLETELGISLLYRDQHAVKLTEAGKIVYEQFIAIQKDYDLLEKRLADHKQALSGFLRCGFLYYAIDDYVNPILKSLSKEMPSFQPQLSYYQPLPLVSALEKGDIDIGITYHYQYENASHFIFKDFLNERPMICCGKKHPLHNREIASLKELAGETIVFLRSKPYMNHFLKILKAVGIENPEIIYCDQIDALDFVLNQTGGVSLMPQGVQNMGRKDLYIIPISEKEFSVPVCIIYKKENQNPLIPLIVNHVERMYKNKP